MMTHGFDEVNKIKSKIKNLLLNLSPVKGPIVLKVSQQSK